MTVDRHQALAEAFADLGRACGRIAAALIAFKREEQRVANREASPAVKPEAPARPKREQKPIVLPDPKFEGDEALSKGGRKILLILAQMDKPLRTTQIAFWLGVQPGSGSVCGPLAELRRDGLIDGTGAENRITPAGREALGEFAPLPMGQALFEWWCAKLGPAADRVLRIFRASDTSLSARDIADHLGVSPGSGSVCGPLAALRKMQLVTSGKSMQLSPDFRRAIEPTISVFDKTNNRSVKVDRSTGHVR